MLVHELLAQAEDIGQGVRADLLRLAEVRRTTDARAFLLGLRRWDACDPAVVWQLRALYNARCPEARLWVPLQYWSSKKGDA